MTFKNKNGLELITKIILRIVNIKKIIKEELDKLSDKDDYFIYESYHSFKVFNFIKKKNI